MFGNSLCFYVIQKFIVWFTKPRIFCFPEEKHTYTHKHTHRHTKAHTHRHTNTHRHSHTHTHTHTHTHGQREITFLLHVYFTNLCLNCIWILIRNELCYHVPVKLVKWSINLSIISGDLLIFWTYKYRSYYQFHLHLS